jgi:hypothetical protein
MWDDLNEPLGFGAAPANPSAPADRMRAALRATAAAAALTLAIGVFALATHRPAPREPFAIAAIERVTAPALSPAAAPSAPASAPVAPPPISTSANDVEAASGAKVTRAGGASAPTPLIIDVARALAGASTPASLDAPAGQGQINAPATAPVSAPGKGNN